MPQVPFWTGRDQVDLAENGDQEIRLVVPDEKWGEAVGACVQLKAGSTAVSDKLISFVKGKIGSMKAPKSIDFIDSRPRSPVGKVLKHDLRAPYWQARERAVS